MIIDNTTLRGHFTIEVIDKDGNVTDTYEDNNLIVSDARLTMGSLLAGKKNSFGITKFLLGTRGHDTKGDNILVGKEIGQDGYDENRNQLFSEEEQTPYYYTVSWNPSALVDEGGLPVEFTTDKVQFMAVGQKKNQAGTETDAENGKIPVAIEIKKNSITYEFTIPEIYANGHDNNSTIAYTEAGLKCVDRLFSIKCFGAKVKDPTSQFKVKWSIIF